MSPRMSAPAIFLQGVRKSFGAVRGLDGFDLTVERGDGFGFLGSNYRTTILSCPLVSQGAPPVTWAR